MRVLTFVFAFVFSLVACAQDAAPLRFQEGVHYSVLPEPVKTVTPGKIEVTEAFAYTCGHCFNFEPLILAWKEKAPEDVGFVKLPVIWRPSMQVYARIMYTGQALGLNEKLDERVFQAIHHEKNALNSEDAIAKVFEELGVPREKFKQAFNSFAVSSKVQQADARTRSMQVRGTPQMIVDGRYTVSVTKELGHQGVLEVVDYLVEKVRSEKGNS